MTRASSLAGTILAVAVLSLAAGAATLPAVFKAPFHNDDVTWAKRSLEPWWFPEPHIARIERTADYARLYFYCIDHPSVSRIVYGQALHAIGVTSLPMEEWDYSEDISENLAAGRILPRDVMVDLRLVNFAFFLGAVILAYAGLNIVVGSRLLACAGALALAIEGTAAAPVNGIVTYIGTDAMLLFFLMLTWVVWLKARGWGLAGAVALGIAGGIAASTKINGAFVVLGAAVYFAAYAPGWRRLGYAAAACAAAAAVFAALNPVYIGGWQWTAQALGDTIERRYLVKQQFMSDTANAQSSIQVVMSTLPQLCFAVPAAAVIIAWRRAWWFPATAFWSLSIIALHMAFLYRFIPQYAAPVRGAFLVLFMAAGMSTVKAFLERKNKVSTGEFCIKGDG